MKKWVPILLMLIVCLIQALYAFSKFATTTAIIVACFSWGVTWGVFFLIRYQKKREETMHT